MFMYMLQRLKPHSDICSLVVAQEGSGYDQPIGVAEGEEEEFEHEAEEPTGDLDL